MTLALALTLALGLAAAVAAALPPLKPNHSVLRRFLAAGWAAVGGADPGRRVFGSAPDCARAGGGPSFGTGARRGGGGSHSTSPDPPLLATAPASGSFSSPNARYNPGSSVAARARSLGDLLLVELGVVPPRGVRVGFSL